MTSSEDRSGCGAENRRQGQGEQMVRRLLQYAPGERWQRLETGGGATAGQGERRAQVF